MPFGKKFAAMSVSDTPAEGSAHPEAAVPSKPDQPPEEQTSGWSWGALAAIEGVDNKINNNIYGEVTADGCALMFKNIPATARLEADSVVYDIGSGYGKFSIWCGTVAKRRSIGIEYNKDRAGHADRALKLCHERGHLEPEDKERIELREGDAFIEGAFADATHLYVCNVGMDEDLHEKLLAQIPRCSNCRVLMTITSLHEGERAVPPEDLVKAGLTYAGKTPTPTTWDPDGSVTSTHYYVTKLGAEAREVEPIKLKLVDAERFAKLVYDVFDEVMSEIPADKI
uniref:DOT1 domain-containing protein n=1 Tax=Hemiselmis tepida TaxID=464990 RepID=A0A7S0VWL7_9CRYP|mmetsp:Transcript_25710/g.65391  ORF Transcript_25710/g.65391 Transcript_25710/m.65391 type:complete len:284 (+) Transcript_25710:45-896(+)